MLGCFGRRKKKSKDSSKQPVDKPLKEAGDEQQQEKFPKSQASSAPQQTGSAASASVSKQPQQPAQQKQEHPAVVAKSPDSSNTEPAPVEEAITVARAQSLYQEAPPASVKQQQKQSGSPPAATGGGVGVRKAATLGRYDFLKRYDRDSFNDRWNTLKQQYLSPRPSSTANGQVKEDNDDIDSSISPESSAPPKPPRPSPLRLQALPPPKLPLSPGFLSNARSLPRQFSPPSTVVSPVKFSNWFHERKIREEEARKECQDREERMQKIIEGPTPEQKETAAVKIQAGFKGYRARVAFKERREEQKRIEECKKREAAAAEAAAAEAAAAEAAAAEAAAAEAAAAEAAVPEASTDNSAPIQHEEREEVPKDESNENANTADLVEDDKASVEAAVKIQAGFRDEEDN